MAEVQKKTCKICGQLKERISAGKFDQRNRRWKDKDGGLWNGLVCPQCHRVKVKLHVKIKRAK